MAHEVEVRGVLGRGHRRQRAKLRRQAQRHEPKVADFEVHVSPAGPPLPALSQRPETSRRLVSTTTLISLFVEMPRWGVYPARSWSNLRAVSASMAAPMGKAASSTS